MNLRKPIYRNSILKSKRKLLVLLLFFFCGNVFCSSLSKKTNNDKWKITYSKLKDRAWDNTDSCIKAGKIWLQEIIETNDVAWKSKALCIIGKCEYIAKKYEESEKSLQESFALQEEINDQEVIGVTNNYLAMMRYNADKYDEAIPYFKKSISALSVSGETWLEANGRYIYGFILYKQKKIGESREQLSQGAKLFDEKYVDTKVEADCYNYLGDLEYYVAEQYEAAAEAYKNASRVYTAKELLEDAAYADYTTGEIYYFYLNDNDLAYEYYKKSYDYYITSTNKKQIANLAKSVGDICNRTQRYDEAIGYLKISADACNETGKFTKEGDCYIVLANIYYFAGNYPDALKYYRQSLVAYEKGNSNAGMAGSYIGLGNFYQNRRDYTKALEMFKKSEELYLKDETPNYSGLSGAYVGIGNFYYDQSDYDNGLKYYLLSIENEEKSDKKIKDNSVALINIANIYMARDDDPNTEKYLQLAIENAERIGNKGSKGSTLRSRGSYYNRKKESQKALDDCSAALKLIEGLGLLPQEQDCYSCMYKAAYNLQLYQDAVSYYAGYIGARDSINNEKRNTETNKRELQYEYEIKATQLKLEEERKQFALQEEIKRKQLFFDFEAKQARFKAATEKKEIAFREDMKRKQLALLYKEKQDSTKLITAKKELGLKQSIRVEQIRTEDQKRLNNWLFGGLAVFGLLMLIILKGYADKRKANKIILKQKEETEHQKEIIELKGMQLEEKNKEIVDSINYARRLQEAILPPHKLVKQSLVDSFILYKPRDIVAGDFYWMESIRNSKLETILFAVADCTGHGVPGAMVSVVCSGALNRAVKEFHLTQPGEILDKVRDLVLETFEKSESQVKDGMDISLCLLDLNNLEVKWAGANNPLWIMRKLNVQGLKFKEGAEQEQKSEHDSSGTGTLTPKSHASLNNETLNFELLEFKPDKQPIGATENPKPFTTHTIKLIKGDILYMSTDGYADQFGGEKGKKFKDSNMKKLLQEICTKPMDTQVVLLDDAMEKWRGSLEQVDDICVAGVKI